MGNARQGIVFGNNVINTSMSQAATAPEINS
jgi:hypothetical protein